MFRWAFAEALLSRWAIKRLCKFLLKKKLGDFILGEIDLDQLEVQLTRGTIQLSDVAVNVDYINQKLSGAVVMLKEGSIASLSITVPWKLQNCQIELEELELVLAPSTGSKIQVPDFYSELINGDKHMNHVPDKNEQGTSQENCGSTSLDIHEGVKMVAKIVKWLLTSFQIRIKNLIVVFDPCLEVNEDKFPDNKSLVFRIAEAEFGTNLSEDTENKTHILKSDCILGTAKLTNFVKFDGALIEVLTMNDIDKSHHSLNCSETTTNRCNSSSLPSGSVTTILTSRGRGISGRMNLSIPWKNGSLDIHKVDAVICFDPIELRLQPSTIEWIIFVWESLKYVGTAVRSSAHCAAIDSGCSNSRLFRYSPVRNSTILGADVAKPSIKKNSVELHSDNNGEIFPEVLLPRTHVIQDWVPLSFKEDQAELEQDYGASIDQFFECFDGLRSSQANSETSVWNWPYSVFNAINVASNLAAGSDHILSEYVETCLRVTVTGISLFLYFHDMEDTIYDPLLGGDRDTNESCRWNHLDTATSCIQDPLSGLSSMDASRSTRAEPDSTGLKIHHLEAKCQDIFVEFQISSQIKDCQVSIKHFKIDEYYDHKSCVRMFGFFDNNSCDLMLINSTLKQKVLSALTPFPVFSHAYDSEKSLLHNAGLMYENYSNEQFIKVGLMESLGDFNLHCTIRLTDMNQTPVSSTSFSLHLPPCVLWFHFHLADSLLNLFKNVEACFKKGRENRDLSDESFYEKKLICPHGLKSGVSSIKTAPTGDSVKGNFVFSNLRIIICFPLQSLEDFDHLYLMDKFIILEHCPFVEELTHVSSFPLNQLSAPNGSSCTSTFSFHFEVGTFDLYLANTINKDATADQSVPLQVKDVSGVKVLTLISRTCDKHSGISMILQNGPVTGHWMASRAWSMASTHDHRSRNKVAREGSEFSSGNVIDDFEETSSDIRQELIYSSKFFIHLSFSVIRLNLQSHNYEQLNNLLDIVMHGFSNVGSSKFSVFEEDQPLCNHDACQATVVMNCDTLDLCIVLDEVPDCSQLAQKEVLGSWNCFRLIVEKFEIMSALNIGGISGTNFFRLIHGEGKLCGSIFNNDGSVLGQIHDIVLISCTNSTSRRGRGDGTNVLSFSSAGTTITYLCNPQLSRSYTSILVHCGTIVAHGGRLDWIGHICSFFSLPFENESSGSDANLVKSSDSRTYEASFILDLVDVALCYEPYLKHSALNGERAYAKCDENHELNQGTSEQLVGYLLAAASFSISSYSLSNSASIDYTIRLQDLGLLICMPSGMNFRCGSYDVSYLRKSGYAKVASSSLLVAVLRIHGLQWEIECSDSHIIFDTCNDTTHGLFHLIAQLQQLYAPDMEDALAHLQSRWINVQESQNTNGSNETSDISNSSTSLDAGMKFPINDDSSLSIRLLDGVVDNAFYITKGSENLEVENSSSTSNSGFDNIDTSFEKGGFLPQLIETHCFPELIAPSLTTKGSPSEVQNLKFHLPDRGKVDRGKGGWYKDEYPMIVDNHIPNSVLPLSDRHQEKNLFVTVDSDAFARRCEKGKILFKNIDVRWHMFAGSDWSKQKINSAGKDTNSSMELSFSGLNIQLSIHPDGDVDVSKLSIHVRDFHVFDRSTNAPWKMVIGQYNSKDHPRESYAKAFKLDLETVRPDPRISLEDYRLYVEFLPVRLHLDQSQINFLINFFGNGSSVEGTLSSTKDVDYINEKKNKAYRGQPIEEEALLPFFQKCVVKPLVVRVDYIPHHMDLTSLSRGNYIELLNLVSWKGIDLNLKQVCAVGIYGWASVCETVAGQWLEDISHNQVHKLLKGLAPVRSLVSVASGTTKLVTLPVKSYKRDGKLLKGMQRGAIAFVRSISLEAVGLGVHLASGVHEILLQTEFILSNVPQSSPVLSEKCRIIKTANSNQPEDAHEGIRQAYESLSEGFSRSASAILGTPMKEYRRGVGAGSALATAVRGTPAAAIAPVTASAHAVHRALLGVRNSLDPEHKKESITKYLGPSQS